MPPKKRVDTELREKLRMQLKAKKISRLKLTAQDEVLDDLEKKAGSKSSSAIKAQALLDLTEKEIESIECKQNDVAPELIGYD
tara:strand:- start:107 stop:355 length:249 start_codon:yes stop_codon:yes gene_type:complete